MDRFGKWLLKKKEQRDAPTEAVPPEAPAPEEPEKKGLLQAAWEKTREIALTPVDPWFAQVARGLDKTRRQLVGRVADLLRLHPRIDDEFWEELEDILITSDVGPSASARIIEELQAVVKEKRLSEPPALLDALKGVLEAILGAAAGQRTLRLDPDQLNVVLVVGVNGTGKTTSCAKLAHRFQQQGRKVLLAAADTFRAAAIEQLQVWGKRLGVDVVAHREGADPAAVVFDAVNAGRARGADVVLVDTAGRLHSKANLMEELKKIHRVTSREVEGAPQEVLLVLDATTGQNALQQARVFREMVGVTGLVLCKLDGTAKGGIIVAIAQEFHLPVKFVGVGEGIEDLREFDPRLFVDALFAGEESRTPR